MTDDELNTAVAREVMGFRLAFQNEGCSPTWAKDEATLVYFLPATNIADAFEVVERIRGDGVVYIDIGEPRADLVSVRIVTDPAAPGGPITRGKNDSRTLPRAICEAALAAVRSER